MGHGEARGVEVGWARQAVAEQRERQALELKLLAQIERRKEQGRDTADLVAMLQQVRRGA